MSVCAHILHTCIKVRGGGGKDHCGERATHTHIRTLDRAPFLAHVRGHVGLHTHHAHTTHTHTHTYTQKNKPRKRNQPHSNAVRGRSLICRIRGGLDPADLLIVRLLRLLEHSCKSHARCGVSVPHTNFKKIVPPENVNSQKEREQIFGRGGGKHCLKED